jgi:hypothetical protein
MEYERMTHVGQVRSCIAGAAGIAITSQAAVSSDFLTTEGLTGLPLSDKTDKAFRIGVPMRKALSICEAIPPPSINKVAQNSPNPNRLS